MIATVAEAVGCDVQNTHHHRRSTDPGPVRRRHRQSLGNINPPRGKVAGGRQAHIGPVDQPRQRVGNRAAGEGPCRALPYRRLGDGAVQQAERLDQAHG